MADFLLDATLFEDYRQGDPDARDLVEKIIAGDASASVSPLTLCRLWASPDFDRKTEVGYIAMLQFMEEASLSVNSARTAGMWLASVDEEERGPLEHFALVAATAHQRGEPIYTREPEPFLRFYSRVLEY